MAIVQPSTGGKAPVIDDDIYEVVCRGVVEKTLENPDQFGKTEKLDFTIEIKDMVDDEGEPIILNPRCNRAWSEKATLFKWAIAFGIDADPMQPLDTTVFHGLEARADIRTEAEGKWPRVHDFLPMPKKARRAAPVQQAEEPEPDYDAFWKKVRAIGKSNADVAALLNGNLNNLVELGQGDLDLLLEKLSA